MYKKGVLQTTKQVQKRKQAAIPKEQEMLHIHDLNRKCSRALGGAISLIQQAQAQQFALATVNKLIH